MSRQPFPFSQKFPPARIKPYIHPVKRENPSMTVVIGFKCADGIVLCADQQITAPGSFKYNECKIHVEKVSDRSIAFAYSGSPGLFKEASDKILKKIVQIEITEDSVYQVVDEVLTEMGRNYVEIGLELLIGITPGLTDVFEEPFLITFDGKALHKADPYSLLGIGNSALVRFLCKTMYSEWLPFEVAINLAIYVVRKAVQFIDYCGDPIDVVLLEPFKGDCRTLSHEDIQCSAPL
jgi:20S proteasome alpha/beta subunit